MKGSLYLIIIISIAVIGYFLYGKKKLYLTLGEDGYKSNEYKKFNVYQNIAVGVLVVSSLAVSVINDNPNAAVNPGVGSVSHDNRSAGVNKSSEDDLDITPEEFVQSYNWALDRFAENDVRKFDGWKISNFTLKSETEFSAKFVNNSSGGISGLLNKAGDSNFAFMSLSTHNAPPAISVAFAFASIYKKSSADEVDEVMNRVINHFQNNGNKSGLQEDKFIHHDINFKLQIFDRTNVSFKIAPTNSPLSFPTR